MDFASLIIPRPVEPDLLHKVTPALANWTYSGLTVLELAAGESRVIERDGTEMVLLPLRGGFTTTFSFPDELSTIFETVGRTDWFSGPTDFMVIGTDVESCTVSTRDGCLLALCTSVIHRVLDSAHDGALDGARDGNIAPDTPPGEHTTLTQYCPIGCAQTTTIGSGTATRQVTTYTLNNKVRTTNLIVLEETIPSGNWTAFPPTKHDLHTNEERQLEEINYFLFRPSDAEHGRAWHKVHTKPSTSSPGELAFLGEVRHGDALIIPFGYSGPIVALPGFDWYRLRILAGPARDNELAETDDPAFAYVRETWRTMAAEAQFVPKSETTEPDDHGPDDNANGGVDEATDLHDKR